MNILFSTVYASTTTDNIANSLIKNIINPGIRLLFVVAILYFMYGVVVFIKDFNNESARDAGKKHMIYSMIGLFIMVSVWGIIAFLSNSVGSKGYINKNNIRGGKIVIPTYQGNLEGNKTINQNGSGEGN